MQHVRTNSNELPDIEVVLSAGKANLYSFVVFGLAFMVFGIPFIFIWELSHLLNGMVEFLTDWLSLILVLAGGMVLHEILHAIVFAAFCKRGFASVTFGIKWKHLSPYVHCREVLRLDPYRLGTLMPGLMLGIVPGVAAVISGNSWLLTFSLFFTAGAAGDFYSLAKLTGVDRRYGVLDHPDEAGFILKQLD
jgi:hypothetical protein